MLPALVANQIAAGEVVERPASVVKELVENSIDARATRIRVELEAGGVELIRVVDDGAGIPAHELPLALAPHATSKVRQASDLDHIATLGFRGEALASIASVSRLSLRSRVRESDQAALLEVEGELDAGAAPRPASGPIGTSITVRNLFYNTPARRKFLRSPTTERERCVEVAEQLALAHPAVGFTIVTDGKAVLDVPPEQSLHQRALAVLGKELEHELVPVLADAMDDARGVTLWGLAGKPSLARGTNKGIRIFVNGRCVRDKTIQHAIAEAYRGIVEPGRHPTVLLMLEMSAAGVDVNVHPQKAEVRFRDGGLVHSVVLRALREALRRADLTPLATSLRPSLGWSPASSTGDPAGTFLHPPQAGTSQPMLLGAQAPGQTGLPGQPRVPSPVGSLADVKLASFFSKFRPGERPFPRTLAEASNAVEADANADAPSGAVGAGESSSSVGASDAPVAHAGEAARMLQVRNSYVITPDEDGVLIIDQHALHERAMFEYLTRRVLAGNLESQRLLAPVPVRVGPGQAALLEELAPLLERIGIEATALGPSDVGVQAFPSFLFERGVEIEPFMSELLRAADAGELTAPAGGAPAGDAAAGRGPKLDLRAAGETALREVLDMMACKAAIKAGDKLSPEEVAELVQLRGEVERSSACPHGRPTSIRITLREIEKLFGRA